MAFQKLILFDKKTPRRRTELFSKLGRDREKYIHMIVLLNHTDEPPEKWKAEVHAFNFTDLTRLEKLQLQPKDLYERDLMFPDILQKIELNYETNRIEITAFNKYQTKKMRDLSLLLNPKGDILMRIIQLQSYARMMINKQLFKLKKDEKKKLSMGTKKHKTMTRFFQLEHNVPYLVNVQFNEVKME
jgi:hypothetical protein